MLLFNLILLSFVLVDVNGQFNRRFEQFSLPMKWRRRFFEKPKPAQVCYDDVGCFDLPHKLQASLKKVPENPSAINTKFYLFRRDIEFSNPETLNYEDHGLSVNSSKLDVNSPMKVIIHGYMGSWIDDGPLNTAQVYLRKTNCNVVVVDWEKGARGPQYANAAANTEVVGRQLGMVLLNIVNKGLNPSLLHLIGFSLGAHVAGCASETLKEKGHLIGRITGLDAASPLFRHNNFKEKSKKLDKDDAVFVDAIHTDASPVFTDGFGLLEPIGHVDFFPNGGFEQPGCADRRASVVMTHLERTITKETACSHFRSWELFLESLEEKRCEFTTFKCKNGLDSFQKGLCFPNVQGSAKSLLNSSYRTDLGKLGEDAKGEGIMYLVTRNKHPYCGVQLHIGIVISKTEETQSGEIHFKMHQTNLTASTKIRCSNTDNVFGLSVVDYNGFNITESITGNLAFLKQDSKETGSDTLMIDKVSVRDIKGQSWSYCNKHTTLRSNKATTIVLTPKSC